MNYTIDKTSVTTFFDQAAEHWNSTNFEAPDIINKILDHAMLSPGDSVLDIACGTGILFPYYLSREMSCITGIDISPKMVEIARQNHNDPRISIYCSDIYAFETANTYDHCIIFNAFPHLGDPTDLFNKLVQCIRCGGTLSIAHSMSRERINHMHRRNAAAVSAPLPPIQELSYFMEPWFDVNFMCSNHYMYQITGTKRKQR